MMAVSNIDPSVNLNILDSVFKNALDISFLFYSRKTIEKKELDVEKKSYGKVVSKIINGIEKLFSEFLLTIIKDIPFPKHLSAKKIANNWLNVSKQYYENMEKSTKREKDGALSKDGEALLEVLLILIKLLTKIDTTFEPGDLIELIPPLERLNILIKEKLEESIQSIYDTKNKFGLIFLESDLIPEFMICISSVFNVLITCMLYMASEFDESFSTLLAIFRKEISSSELAKNSKTFFDNSPKIIELYFKITIELFRFQMFIIAWHSKDLKDLLFPKERVFSMNNLDQKYFQKMLDSLSKLSDELHDLIIEIAYQDRKMLPFALSNDPSIDEEELTLISRLIPPNNF